MDLQSQHRGWDEFPPERAGVRKQSRTNRPRQEKSDIGKRRSSCSEWGWGWGNSHRKEKEGAVQAEDPGTDLKTKSRTLVP